MARRPGTPRPPAGPHGTVVTRSSSGALQGRGGEGSRQGLTRRGCGGVVSRRACARAPVAVMGPRPRTATGPGRAEPPDRVPLFRSEAKWVRGPQKGTLGGVGGEAWRGTQDVAANTPRRGGRPPPDCGNSPGGLLGTTWVLPRLWVQGWNRPETNERTEAGPPHCWTEEAGAQGDRGLRGGSSGAPAALLELSCQPRPRAVTHDRARAWP